MQCKCIPPEMGTWALNAKGAISREKKRYGSIIRDDHGKPSYAYKCGSSAELMTHVELITIYERMKIASREGIRDLVVYSDFILAVQYINDEASPSWQYAHTVRKN